MEYDRILIRYGELTLKGKNKKDFINQCYKMIKEKCLDLKDIEFEKRYERLYIVLNGTDYRLVFSRLNKVFGIHSYSLVKTCESDLEAIKKLATDMVKEEIKDLNPEDITFKVSTKRAYKRFYLTSLEISKEVSSYVLKNTALTKVDVHNPKMTLNIELREEATYIFFKQIMGLGGLPVGTSGRALLLISGGIDSPVAGYMALKRGVNIEMIHFESTPLTPIESAQKVIDLVKKVSAYGFIGGIKLYMVPFKNLHEKLLSEVPDNYIITIMRRMMIRIACSVAKNNNCLALFTGESLGQVASQTIESINVINEVTNMPILRPLIAMDKDEIIEVSEKIDTYDISIRPFEDCCTVYLPKRPSTRPKLDLCKRYESRFDYEKYVQECVDNVQIIRVNQDTDIDLPSISFQVELPDYYKK